MNEINYKDMTDEELFETAATVIQKMFNAYDRSELDDILASVGM